MAMTNGSNCSSSGERASPANMVPFCRTPIPGIPNARPGAILRRSVGGGAVLWTVRRSHPWSLRVFSPFSGQPRSPHWRRRPAARHSPSHGSRRRRVRSRPRPQVLEQVRCGYVTVPENRSVPDGRRLRLAVAILKSLSSTPRPDPVVYLAGGPGNTAVDRAPGLVINGTMDALRADRDVILYDQRGIGFSEPAFCPEVMSERAGAFDSPAARRAHQRQLFARCGDAMRRAGYDLSQYNSVVSAHDLQDLRRALGYEQWNLHGRSYGTRVALVAMRVAPKGIRSAVLDGPAPPNRAKSFNMPGYFVDVLKRLSGACARQADCNAAFPEVEQTFWRTVDALEREPRTLQVTPPNGTTTTTTVTGARFAAGVHTAMERLQPAVPLLVHAMRPEKRQRSRGDAGAPAQRADRDVTGRGWARRSTVSRRRRSTPLNCGSGCAARILLCSPIGVFPDPSGCEGSTRSAPGPITRSWWRARFRRSSSPVNSTSRRTGQTDRSSRRTEEQPVGGVSRRRPRPVVQTRVHAHDDA